MISKLPDNISRDFLIDVQLGKIPGYSYVNKFGSHTLTTTLSAIAVGGVYQTPTAATALEFVSGNANDSSAGTGAQQITVIGLDASWNEVTQTVETNGVTPVALSTNLTRLYRFYVSRSGTYGTVTSGSHAGQLTIRGSGGGSVWGQTSTSGILPGQSEIAAYTVPIGFTAYLISEDVFVDSVKAANVYFINRQNADDVTTPFSGGRRLSGSVVGLTSSVGKNHRGPQGPFVGPCDLIYIGQTVSGTASVVAEFDLLIVQDGS